MKKSYVLPSRLCLFAAFLAWNIILPAAQTTPRMLYHVSIDSTQLQSHDAGPFSLSFVLVDGSGVGDSNATITITNFNFGLNGDVDGDPEIDGSASGSLTNAVILTDALPEGDFSGQFTPGATLTFDIYATLSLDTGGASDELDFAITDSSGVRIPTLDTNEANALVRLTTSNGTNITVESYNTDPTLDPEASGPPLSFGPLVLLNGNSAPTNRPVLAISTNHDGTNTISWPSEFGNMNLEESTNLTSWSLSALSPVIVGTNITVTLTPLDPSMPPHCFYRLAE